MIRESVCNKGLPIRHVEVKHGGVTRLYRQHLRVEIVQPQEVLEVLDDLWIGIQVPRNGDECPYPGVGQIFL